MSSLVSMVDVIRTNSKERGNAVAIIQDDFRQTWAELDERSNRVANALATAGVGAHDRVAFIDKNGYEYFEVLFGAAKLNAVTVNVNWRLAPPEVAWIVNNAEAKVFFVGEEFADAAKTIRDCVPNGVTFVCLGDDDRFESYESWISEDTSDPGALPTGADVAFQMYSSGTTGRPKGVMLSNNNLFASATGANETWGLKETSVSLVAMPLFHMGGAGWAMVGMINGAASVIVRDIDPAGLIATIGKERVTHAFLVPAVLQSMLMTPNVAEADHSSLEMLVYGAAPITEEVLAAAIRTFGCDFAQVYGLTETTGVIATLAPEDHHSDGPKSHLLRSAGTANPNVELKIVDPDSFEEVPTGQVGEVITRSGQNMIGYWKDTEGTAATYVDGDWFRTGDIGYFGENGYLYIHDRVKDMIVSGGENVYPAEVENVLMKHPGIADVAVIGVPDERWGESGKAIAVRAAGDDSTAEEIIAFAREQLAAFKVPKSIDFIEEIPRNPSGKTLKKELRAPFWEGRKRNV